MKEKLGTILGFSVGFALIFFGIIWPDHLSNYYIYQLRVYEAQIEELKREGVPPRQIREKEAELKAFTDSWFAGITRFVDLKSFLIVFGGSYAAALIAFPLGRAVKAFVFIGKVFTAQARTDDFITVYQTITAMAEKRSNNEIITDEEINAVENEQLRKWIQDFIAVDLVEEEMIQEIIRSEIEMYNYRSFEEIDLLEFMGRAAPAFGMIGTVVGLILMLGRTGAGGADIVGVMGGMSVALITTLYGVLLAQLIFLPSASKRYQLKESHVMLLEMVREGILYLKRRELAEIAAMDLIIYLPQIVRQQILEEQRSADGLGL